MSFTIDQPPDGEIFLYVRDGGSDSNPGTLALPLASPTEAVRRLKFDPTTRSRQVIEMTGLTWTSADTQRWVIPCSGTLGYAPGRPNDGVNGVTDYFDGPVEFRADPTLVTTITVDAGSTYDTIGEVQVINVVETLTPDAHKGQFLVAAPAENAVILSNTANTITCISVYDIRGYATIPIYTLSCVLDAHIDICGAGQVVFEGIQFANHLLMKDNYQFTFDRCIFDQYCWMLTSGYNWWFDCYWSPTSGFYTDGGGFQIVGAVFDGGTVAGHGSGGVGVAGFDTCLFDGCGPIGAGNFENVYAPEIVNSTIWNGTGYGVQKQAGSSMKLKNVRIENCALGGVLCDTGGGPLQFQSVVGVNAGPYGVTMQNGSQLKCGAGNTVSGATGDILLGKKPVTWVTVDALPVGNGVTDTDQVEADQHLCRVYAI